VDGEGREAVAVIDTLKLATRLEAAGFTREQARGQAEAMAEFVDTSAATKGDLAVTEARLHAEIERAKNETIRWFIGVGGAQIIVALLLKYLR
jgi:hypothetical protein